MHQRRGLTRMHYGQGGICSMAHSGIYSERRPRVLCELRARGHISTTKHGGAMAHHAWGGGAVAHDLPHVFGLVHCEGVGADLGRYATGCRDAHGGEAAEVEAVESVAVRAAARRMLALHARATSSRTPAPQPPPHAEECHWLV
jgi:hypothetical protein